ncbi:hypothetical protein NPIL_329691 [Nephila pilipes]|uniref:Uncharacterized protein n=1 Tax=Nephila pilipes TaxID=299642 RepID=A0A8X6NZ25_NEPPI|nr:hypothetical protein NPIL_329691 [Nephila pilipes]
MCLKFRKGSHKPSSIGTLQKNSQLNQRHWDVWNRFPFDLEVERVLFLRASSKYCPRESFLMPLSCERLNLPSTICLLSLQSFASHPSAMFLTMVILVFICKRVLAEQKLP